MLCCAGVIPISLDHLLDQCSLNHLLMLSFLLLLMCIQLQLHQSQIYDALDMIQISLDTVEHSVVFNLSRSHQDLLAEFTTLGLHTRDQNFILQKIIDKQRLQKGLRQHAVPIAATSIQTILHEGIDRLACDEDEEDEDDDEVDSTLTGAPHLRRTQQIVLPKLIIWEESTNQQQRDDLLLQVTCTLLIEAHKEITRLFNGTTTTLFSSAFSFRWLADPGQSLVILSRARNAMEPPFHQREVTSRYMKLSADLLDAALDIQISTDILYASAIVHRTLGNYDVAAERYRTAALIRFSPDLATRSTNIPSSSMLLFQPPHRRSPSTEDTKMFYYSSKDDAATLPDHTRGTSHHLFHEANQILYLIDQQVTPFYSHQTSDWLHIAKELKRDAARLVLVASNTAAASKRRQHEKKITNNNNNQSVAITVLHELTQQHSRFVHGRILTIAASPALNGTHSQLFGEWCPHQLEASYFNRTDDNDVQVTFVDNFLSEETLAQLRKFIWTSTIFLFAKGDADQTSYRENGAQAAAAARGGGYLGAYLESGFGASGLLLQIAGELRRRLPSVIGEMRLVQAWGYKV